VAEMQDLREAFGCLEVAPASIQEAGASVPTRFTVTLGQCEPSRGGKRLPEMALLARSSGIQAHPDRSELRQGGGGF